MTNPTPSSFLPLREPTFFILLSLIPGEKHGYAILKDVESLSSSALRLSTGTLYEALSRLLEQNLIERVEQMPASAQESSSRGGPPGKPRKVYRLTELGRKVIEAEAARLQTLAAAAQRQLDLQQQMGQQLGAEWKGTAFFA